MGRQQPVAIRATIVVNESLKGTTSNVPSIISITATAAHPRAAAIAANQAARLLIERSKKTTARTLRAGIESVRAQIEEVEAQTRELERLGEDARDSLAVNQLLLTKSSLEGQLIELRTAKGLLRPSYVLTQPATTPAAPTAPKTVRNLLVGAGAGLILGLVVGVLLSLRPHAKRTSHQVSSAFMDVPKLGVMVWPDPGTQDLTPIADGILYAASLEQARSVGLAVDSLTHDTEHACAALRSALLSANRRVKFVTVETRLDSSTKEHESSSSEPAPNLGPDAITTLLSTHEPDTQVMVLGPLALCGDPTTAHILSMVDRLVIMIDARDLDRAALLHIGRRVAQLRQRPLGLVLMQHGSPG